MVVCSRKWRGGLFIDKPLLLIIPRKGQHSEFVFYPLKPELMNLKMREGISFMEFYMKKLYFFSLRKKNNFFPAQSY